MTQIEIEGGANPCSRPHTCRCSRWGLAAGSKCRSGSRAAGTVTFAGTAGSPDNQFNPSSHQMTSARIKSNKQTRIEKDGRMRHWPWVKSRRTCQKIRASTCTYIRWRRRCRCHRSVRRSYQIKINISVNQSIESFLGQRGSTGSGGEQYLTHVVDAVIVVDGAVLAAETGRAHARVVVAAVHAGGAVAARIELLGAELDLLVTVSSWSRREGETQIPFEIWIDWLKESTGLTGEPAEALTSVGFDQIYAGWVVGALVLDAVVDVGLASVALVAGGAVATVKDMPRTISGIQQETGKFRKRSWKKFIFLVKWLTWLINVTLRGEPESSFFEDLAGGPVAARIAVAGVDGRLAEFAVVARGAQALVVPLGRRSARGPV